MSLKDRLAKLEGQIKSKAIDAVVFCNLDSTERRCFMRRGGKAVEIPEKDIPQEAVVREYRLCNPATYPLLLRIFNGEQPGPIRNEGTPR